MTYSGFMYKPEMLESIDDLKGSCTLLAHDSSSCICLKSVLSKMPSDALVDYHNMQGLIYNNM